jgi:SAM-dependent methyltransferase
MALTAEALRQITARTLAHYDQRARAYWEGTRDHDVSQNINALLEQINTPPPFTLLDFGCGPGRDLSAFKARGHRVIGLDGSPQLAELARANSACEVLEQNFLELDLPSDHFDGVFANAVLFHIPGQELPRILRELHATLKPGDVLYRQPPRQLAARVRGLPPHAGAGLSDSGQAAGEVRGPQSSARLRAVSRGVDRVR